MIERVSLRARGKPLGPGERSAHSLQHWFGEWKALRAQGWDVTVIVARDYSHAVGLATR